MRLPIIPTIKFVGTVSLGLLTGISYTTATQSLRSLFALPSAGAANTSYLTHKRATLRSINIFSAISISTYALAYTLAPRQGRHPYLLYTSVLVALSGGVDYFLSRGASQQESRDMQTAAKANQKASNTMEMEESDEDFEDLKEAQSLRVNGEEVRLSMEGWKFRETVRGSVSAVAFMMAVVGMWGDGARV
ncbi:MAG: hypothetical protein M1828_000958 [Chrysothrix sp. TS-e1954]|nr:MAG: hypothetical protein M1828_000958 [Chrysothrix sp. TS-e1954]